MDDELYAQPLHVKSLKECNFYHTMDVPGYGTVTGAWDLRGKEAGYLGNVPLKGKRVLEIGPASGCLSFFMESCGAEVVSVDGSKTYQWEYFWNIPNSAPPDLKEKMGLLDRMGRANMFNSYWLCHRAFASKARVHYGSAYSLPAGLGEFDISVLACVLLHNKHPLHILENCARVTRETIVIVEPPPLDAVSQHGPIFVPQDNSACWNTWWLLPPAFAVRALRTMGFTGARVQFHKQLFNGEPTELYTLVAHRTNAKGPLPGQLEQAPLPASALRVQIDCATDRLRSAAGGVVRLPLRFVNLGKTPLSGDPPYPMSVSYHWRTPKREMFVHDGRRTLLPWCIQPGGGCELLLNVDVPNQPGEYLLEIAMVQERVTWFEGLAPGLPRMIEVSVRPNEQRLNSAPL